MIKIKFEGFEIAATGHDISKEEWLKLSNKDLNHPNICEVIDNYDPWSTNYFEISRPLIDENLTIEVFDKNNNSIWVGNCDMVSDIYEHADKFPEIEKIDNWDEPDQKGDAVWPISTASFVIMYKNPEDKKSSTEVLKFFDWAFKNGKKDAADLDYVSLPDSLTKQIRERVWTQIK